VNSLSHGISATVSRELRREWRRAKSLWCTVYFGIACRFGRRKLTGQSAYVVSMTSYGIRLGRCHLAIESVGRGRMRPKRLMIWLADGERIPLELRRLERRGLEIRCCPELLSHKKYFPYSMSHDGALKLVTCDDDVFYPRRWLSDIDAVMQRDKVSIVAHRARRIDVDDGGGLAPYSSWEVCNSSEASLLHVATGVGGVGYPSCFVRVMAGAGSRFMEAAPYADDIWLHVLAVRSNVPVRQVKRRAGEFPAILGTQVVALSNENVSGGGNDDVISRLYSEEDLDRLRREAKSTRSGGGELE